MSEAVRAVGEDFTRVALQKARGAADVWRDFATEWLLSRKVLWIGMFLLLLLLARPSSSLPMCGNQAVSSKEV